MQQVILHLGAHKTASTHFSEVILSNPELARSFDVATPKKGPLREAITGQLSSIKDNADVPPALQDAARGLARGHKTLLVMDENILGTPRNLFVGGKMYARSARRVGRAVRLFDGLPVTLMIGLRDPATFVASSWSETLRSNAFRSFRQYLDGATAQSISWVEIIQNIQAAAPQAKLVVWRFEDYRTLLPELVARALMQPADAGLTFTDITEPVRVGMSDRALKEIRDEGKQANAALSTARVEQIMATFPKSAEYPAPKPWTAAERLYLNDHYAQEVETLRGMDGITFLGT